MKLKKILFILKIIGALVTLLIILLSIWTWSLNKEIDERLAQGWFSAPIEFYSRGTYIYPGSKLSSQEIVVLLKQHAYVKRETFHKIQSKQFAVLGLEQCSEFIDLNEGEMNCIAMKNEKKAKISDSNIIVLHQDNYVSRIWSSLLQEFLPRIQLPKLMFAQYFGNKAILRQTLELGQIPLYCLNAITSIEDRHFLEHKGISPFGIMRAMVRNAKAGRWAQGGSTITQQLIKNYFLTSEKTLKRKFIEFFMAILLEIRTSKDQILSAYLNEIYMGQNGPFEVRGFGAASQHYFSKDIKELNLAQCSLLAAIVNSPGRYNPKRNPDKALQRRNLVLSSMLKFSLITDDQFKASIKQSLQISDYKKLVNPAPYYLQYVKRQLNKLDLKNSAGLKVYTSIDLKTQGSAQNVARTGLEALEKKFPELKKKGEPLQSAILTLDVASGEILAIVGGRGYLRTQYNRILDAKRQVGSIMKPLVYLSALETVDRDGKDYSPMTVLPDNEFTYKYEGQSWSPKNFDLKFRENVPLFYALSNSLNVPTAKLGIDIGLNSIIDVAKRLGINSELKAYPSITLGAFELKPLEVAQAFLTIAGMGQEKKISAIESVTNFNDEVLFQKEKTSSQKISRALSATLIGMLKHTFDNGTAQSARWKGFKTVAAGKTGTTSNTKDTWFVGFTPEILTLVWVGFDKNYETDLTGASGALNLWVTHMLNLKHLLHKDEFEWPESVEIEKYTKEELLERFPNILLLTDEIPLVMPPGVAAFDE